MNLLYLSRSTVGQTVSSKDGSTYTFIPSYMLVLQWAWHFSQREVGSLFPPYEPEQGPVTASNTGVWQNATKYVTLKPRPHERYNSPSLSPRLLGYLPLALSHHVWGNPAHIEGGVQWRYPGWQPQPAPSREQASIAVIQYEWMILQTIPARSLGVFQLMPQILWIRNHSIPGLNFWPQKEWEIIHYITHDYCASRHHVLG